MMQKQMTDVLFQQNSPALYSGLPSTKLNPACFPLTTPLVLAQAVMVWARKCISTRNWSSDEALSLNNAIAPWANSSSVYYGQTLKHCPAFKIDIETPFAKLPKDVRDTVLYGSGKEEITISYNDGKRSYKVTKPFEGVIPNMERRWRETDSSWVRDELSKYQTVTSVAIAVVTVCARSLSVKSMACISVKSQHFPLMKQQMVWGP